VGIRMELNDEFLIELETSSTARLDKAIPGAKWSASRSLWLLPLSWAACTVAREVLGAELEIGEKLAKWACEEYESRVLPASVARESEDGPEFVPAALGDPADTVDRLGGEMRGSGSAVDTVEKAEETWWWDIWRGMPEFLQRDLSPKRQLIVNFSSVEDFEEFSRRLGQRIGPRVPSVWFPEVVVQSEYGFLWSDEDQQETDRPMFPSQERKLAAAREDRT
jgi:hypothetical protein